MPHLAPLHGHKVDRQHHIVLATNPHLDLGFMVNGLGFFCCCWKCSPRTRT